MNARIVLAIVLAEAIASPGTVQAQTGGAATYPLKPIRWIIDFPAGGVSDTIARAVSARWSEALGQPIVVDPRPGGGGMLAYGLGARAIADGYTMSFVSAPFVLLVSLHEKPQYRVTDFAPVGLIGTAPNILVAAPKVMARSARELIAWAKGRPDAVNFASVGVGSGPHLSGELFNQVTGIRATHVPFNGSAAAMNDLMAGRVDYMFVNLPSAAPLVKSGRLQLLAAGGERRIAGFPDTPTVAEAGFPGFRSIGFYGVAAPAGLPAAVTTRLQRELAQVLALPDVRERLATLGVDPPTSELSDFRAFMLDETKRWERVIREAKVKIDS
ncbi:MAG: tripartite tricarboxylate transporter substrate binding protein [Proteobacteria bacterium]|nr:tripartite tricarboxylate transporter substrate binding protein [Burkholderiales bacterium]